MIFLKRRALMTRASFNYKTVSGIGSIVLENCVETRFKRLVLSGNSKQTSTTGKNLFDIAKLKSKTIPTENINIEESTITLPAGGAIYFNKLKDVCTDLKVGDEVCLFAKTTGGRSFIGFYHESVSISSWNFNAKNTITENVLNSALLLYSDVDKTVVISDIMITKVNDKTYEPYTGGKPSPSPEYPQEIVSAGKYDETSVKYLFDVNVIGKNLIDIDALKNENGYMSGAYEKSRDIDHFNIVKG